MQSLHSMFSLALCVEESPSIGGPLATVFFFSNLYTAFCLHVRLQARTGDRIGILTSDFLTPEHGASLHVVSSFKGQVYNVRIWNQDGHMFEAPIGYITSLRSTWAVECDCITNKNKANFLSAVFYSFHSSLTHFA